MRNVSQVSLFCESRPSAVFTGPASRSTLARTIFALGGELMPCRLDQVMADARTKAWDAASYQPESLILDVDATLLNVHSDKQWAAPTFKQGFGFHPLGMWLDETREPLAMILRPGNAGSNTATDHCEILERSLDQLPEPYRVGHEPGDAPEAVLHPLLVRSDGAGATKAFVADLVDRNIEFSVGFAMNDQARTLIGLQPDDCWVPAINTDRTNRHGAEVVELTSYTHTKGWPKGARLICRREEPHPGATLSLFDQVHGRRHTMMLTNTTGGDIANLELRHRQHARVEDRIRCWKDSGASRQPSWDAPANQAWLNVSLIGLTLIAWAQHLGFDGELAKAEPATFRARVLHIAAQYATRGRRLHLNLDQTWPWAEQIAVAYQRIRRAFAGP